MSTIPAAFEATLSRNWPPEKWRDTTLLVAVSGGADSVALLRALDRLIAGSREHLVVAHYNHGLRGAASQRDAQFVRRLANKLSLAVEVGNCTAPDELRSPGGDGLEAAARAARYRFLHETAKRCGARYVVTAHTANDQAETILHRILRGTGLAGLAGIPTFRALSDTISLVRPLLPLSREQVLEYLQALDQSFCHDGSNNDPTWTRNRLRNELLPQLAEQYNPRVVEALLRLGQLAGEARTALQQQVDECLQQTVAEGSPLTVDAEQLARQSDYLIGEVLIEIWKRQSWPQQDMGLDKWRQLSTLVRLAASGGQQTVDLPGGLRVQASAGRLTFSPLCPSGGEG